MTKTEQEVVRVAQALAEETSLDTTKRLYSQLTAAAQKVLVERARRPAPALVEESDAVRLSRAWD